jgi:ADP-ribose pyrophosphatase
MLMQGGCDELMVYYCARVALPDAVERTAGLAHEGEDIRILLLPAEAAFALLDEGRIQTVTAACCLWWLRHHRARLRAAWT